jgi:hypothetical protein
MPALVVRVRERFGPRRLLGEALLAFLVVVLIPSSASRAVETAAGVAGGEKADQVTMDCIVVKLGRPHVTMATVIASNEQRSYLVTTLDPGCAQRVAYVRGDRSHGIKSA